MPCSALVTADESNPERPYCSSARDAFDIYKKWELIYSGGVVKKRHGKNYAKSQKDYFGYEVSVTILHDADNDTYFSEVSGERTYSQGRLIKSLPRQLRGVAALVIHSNDTAVTLYLGDDKSDSIELLLVSDGCHFSGNSQLGKYGDDSMTYGVMNPKLEYKEAD